MRTPAAFSKIRQIGAYIFHKVERKSSITFKANLGKIYMLKSYVAALKVQIQKAKMEYLVRLPLMKRPFSTYIPVYKYGTG